MLPATFNCDRLRVMPIIMGLILLLCPVAIRAQQSSEASDLKQLREQIRVLAESQRLLAKELEALKASLDGNPKPTEQPLGPVIQTGGLRSNGKSDAPLVLLAFTGYECSHCAKFATDTEPQVKRDYVATGKVRYVFCDFMFDNQKNGAVAARAAHCAGDQEKFWEMHDLLFSGQGNVPPPKLMAHAEQLNLDMTGFKQCLDDGLHVDTIKRSMDIGAKLGVTGTPAFFIGIPTGEPNEIQVVRTLRGNVAYDVIKRALDAALTRR
jgi:protein-disulfide isomerase